MEVGRFPKTVTAVFDDVEDRFHKAMMQFDIAEAVKYCADAVFFQKKVDDKFIDELEFLFRLSWSSLTIAIE